MNIKYRVEIFKDGKWKKCYGYSISFKDFTKRGWTKSFALAKQLKNSLSKQYPNANYRIVAKYICIEYK